MWSVTNRVLCIVLTSVSPSSVGLQWVDVAQCIQWMAPFAMVLRELGPVELKFFSQVPSESTHNVQTHVIDLGLLVGGTDNSLKFSCTSPHVFESPWMFLNLAINSRTFKNKGFKNIHDLIFYTKHIVPVARSSSKMSRIWTWEFIRGYFSIAR